MDNQNNIPNPSEDQDWLDKILGEPTLIDQIGPDEHAISSAGLTHPDDLELEQILAENWQDIEADEQPNSTEESTAVQEPAVDDSTRFFTAVPDTDVPNQEEPPAPEQPAPTPPVRKGRPKRKKGYGLLGIPHILATGIWLAIILACGISLGRVIWVCCTDVMAFGKPSQQVTITITQNDDIASISKKLADAELIRYPGLFKMFAEVTKKDENISVGTFTLNSHLDYNAMINAMTEYASAREVVEIMFPEGYNCAQIFALLEKEKVCSVEDLEAYAAEGELDEYWFLEGVKRGDKYCLEGYLFPDTYKFYTDDEPRRVIEKFLDGFDYRFTDLMKEKITTMQERYAAMMASHGYGQEYIDANPLTIRNIVIIASLIEKETSGGEESYDIASVIYNRLANQAENPFLNIDAALVYALGGKDELTEADKEFDSPYNTYKYPGLIPGPISNPGRDSLYAALDPNDTNYLYYALNPETGKHHFTRSYDEHLAFLNSLEG